MKTGKKILSVLLTVVMVISSVSISFSTFAAAKGVSNGQWTALIDALKNDTVAGASFSGQASNYSVNDPDGSVIAAVRAYVAVYDALADMAPASSSAGNRTINQVNTSIKNELSSRMGADYATYNVANFITGLTAGATVSTGTSSEVRVANNANKPNPPSSFAKPADVKVTVNLDNALLSYGAVEDLPDSLVTKTVFTFKHNNTSATKRDGSETTGSGCNQTTTQYDYYTFFYSVSATTETAGASEDIRYIKNIKTDIAPYASYFTATLDYLVENVATGTLSDVKSAVNTIYGKLSKDVWDHFYGEYDVSALGEKIDLAVEIITVKAALNNLDALMDEEFAGSSTAQLEKLHADLITNLGVYNGASADAKAYFTDFDLKAVEDFMDDVVKEKELAQLRDFKQTIDEEIKEYYTYNDNDVADGKVTSATLNLAKGTVNGWLTALASYDAQNIAAVWGETDIKAELGALIEELNRLITLGGYKDEWSAKYAEYVSSVYANTNLADDSAELLAAIKNYDNWYTGLKELISSYKAELGEELAERIFAGLDTQMKAHLDGRYSALYARITAQLELVTELYEIIRSYGSLNLINADNFANLKTAFAPFEKEVYDFLDASPNFEVDKNVKEMYDYLSDMIEAYDAYVASNGFSGFETQLMEYLNRRYKDENGNKYYNDITKTEEYKVTEKKILDTINDLDKILTSKEIGSLLGGLLGAEGEADSLGAILENLVKGMLFSDSFINTVVQALYPLILGELIKVWEKDLGSLGSLLTKNLHDVIRDTGLALYPDLLGSALEQIDKVKYADNIAKLKATPVAQETHPEYEEDGTTIKEIVVDSTSWSMPPSEESVLAGTNLVDPETGALTLTWGVDAVRENGGTAEEIEQAFYVAFDDAFDALKPLFHALLANKQFDKTVEKVMYYSIVIISAGADLDITASGNQGYANMLVPIFEVLGVDYTEPGIVEGYADQANSLELILKAVLDPIFAFLGGLGEAPLSTLIGILPNLCYALSTKMVIPLLNMLRTHLEIHVTLTGVASLIEPLLGDLLNNLPSMDIAIGDLLDGGNLGDNILDDMGIDLSGGINTILKGFGIEIPEINQALVAQLGELETIETQRKAYLYSGLEGTGTAYNIVADKAGVGYYLLSYIFGILSDAEAFENLLSAFITVEVPQVDENGEPVLDENGNAIIDTLPDEAKIAEVIATLNDLGLTGLNVGDAIGAVVELFNQEENNNFAEYEWFESEATDSTVAGMTPALQQYLGYDTDWTRDKANYIIDNIDELIATIMTMVTGEETSLDIGAMLTDAISALFTNANITALAKLLSGLDLNALLAGGGEAEDAEIETTAEGEEGDEGEEGEAEAAPAIDIAALLKDILGVDLGAYAQYADLAEDATWGFEDGDKDGFIAALVELLEPLSPVVNFLLAGDDLDILGATTLYGYNGYDTALVPLLEALGCKAPVLEEGDNALSAVLNALLDRIAELNSVDAILDIIPGLLYFVQSNGLSTVVRNLLHPVYVILDTIRPIIDVDLNELIGGLTLEPLGFAINLDDIGFGFVFDILGSQIALNLDEVELIIADICKVLDGKAYKSSSSIIGENGKRGAYSKFFDEADLVTVLLSFAISWIQEEGNADAIIGLIAKDDAEKAAEIKKYISGAINIINGIEFDYEEIDWAYNFPNGFDEAIFNSGIYIEPTINSLTYPNDWTEESAKYVAENLDSIIAEVLAATGSEYTDLGAMLKDKVNFYTAANVQTIVDLVAGLLEDIDAMLLDTIGTVLDVDLNALKAYKADEGIDTAEEFAAALADVLGTIQPVADWLFFGKDYTFFSKSGAPLITIKGTEGYAYGLAPILEALGADVPAKKDATVENVLLAAFNRVDEILADPVNEALDLLPNIIYFLNANGVSISVKNLLAGITALTNAVQANFGLELDLMSLFNDLINGLLPEDATVVLDITNLDLKAVFALVQELLGMDLTPIESILVDLCVGQIKPYTSASGEYGFKMMYADEFDKHDMITIIVTAALLVIEIEENAKVLDELLGTEIISALTGIFQGATIEYTTPDWDYCFDPDDMEGDTIGVMDSALTYPNDWTKESSQYIVDNLEYLDGLVAGLVDSNYSSLGELVGDKVNIYSGENIQAIVDLIAGLLGNIDEKLLDLAGLLLGADLNGLAKYKAPAGIDTAEEFAAELANVLTTYAKGVVEWFLLGQNYEFFVAEDANEDGVYDEDIITITGAHGYAEGLALLLEAIGCENLPEAYTITPDTEEIVNGVLTSLFTRVDEILANPVVEVFDILPNILYFLNTNGVAAVIDNLLAAINALLEKLSVLGLDVDIEALINIEELLNLRDENGNVLDLAISTDNLTIAAVLEVVSVMTDFDLTVLEDVLVGFALGSVVEYDSVSTNSQTYKMIYADDIFAKRDMVTVLATAVLLMVENEANAEKLDKLLGTNIVSALKTIFASALVKYETPDWDYCLDNDDVVNNTIGVMEYAITYPNNWTEESAQYVVDHLGELGDMIAGLIDSNYTSLGALASDKITIYSAENIQTIVDMIAGLLGDIDSKLLEAAGILLDVDLVGLANYKAPAGIDTAEEFSAELANVLTTYAKGVVEWLLLGRNYKFFVEDRNADGKYVEGEDIITINGGHGYAEGLALVLEALGCENLPEAYDTTATTEEIINGVLTSLFTRVDKILADPVVEIFDILPNILYFLNANGLAVVVDNLLAAVYALVAKLEVLDINLDINSLINIEELLGVEEDLAISLDNLTVAAVLEVVSVMTGLDLAILEDVLVGFALGRVEVNNDSVSRHSETYKMYYHDDFAKCDMVTVIANAVLLTIEDENNAEKIKELLGEDIYEVILNIFNMKEVPVQEINWIFTERADTDYVFSAISTSDLYEGFLYGPLYTEEMAQYIADNIGTFIDNALYLVGVNINGENIDNLKDLISTLVNGSVYNSKNVVAIRDLLANVLSGIANMTGGKHIAAILKSSLGVDLNAVAAVQIPEFDNNRDMFVEYLCDVIEPLYPILRWLLCDEDFTFFVNEDKTDLITLTGAEGYAFGIIPLLEALDCEGIVTRDAYNAAVKADNNVLLTSILTPLLDRVDEILDNPADEILGMLPNIIYFINSNGVDTVVKNTLNAVYALLNAIEPIAKIDLYELIGLDLSTLTFEKLFDMLLDMIAEATGYRFASLDASAVTELSIGKLVSYESANGNKAYKMIYHPSEGSEAEMVTAVMRLIVTFVVHENNREMLVGLLKDNLGVSADSEKYLKGLLDAVAAYATGTQLGMDQALATIYYVFYGVDIAVGETNDAMKDVNAKWQAILQKLGKSDNPNEITIGNFLGSFLDKYLDDVITSDGIAPNGFVALIQKIINWFKSIFEWIKNLFS